MSKEDKSAKIHQRDKVKEELKIRDLNWTEKQKEFIKLALDKKTKLIFISGPAGSSKAQPLDVDILTSSGWVKMGDLKIGDQVFSSLGSPTTVLGIFPQGEKEIYKLTFSDGASTECCAEHLWRTQTCEERYARKRIVGKRSENGRYKSPKEGQVRNTLEILNTLFKAGGKRPNHHIPLTAPINFAEAPLLLPPYVLGALLGDGGLSTGCVNFTSSDSEIIEKIRSLLPENVNINKKSSSKYDYSITDEKASCFKENRIKTILKNYGLMYKKSNAKFIPDCYKFNSIENRLELLRGLMDTDGTTSGFYNSFTTVSDQLAKDVVFLVQSLGGTARFTKSPSHYVKNGKKIECQDAYRVSVKLPNEFNPFYLPRKADKIKPNKKYFPRRIICNIEKIGKKDCQCIYVEDEPHTYLTNDCIVTHNTILSIYCSLQLMKDKRISEIMYIRSPVESSDSKIGFLPGDADEKLKYYNLPFADKLDELLNKGQIDILMQQERIKGHPLSFVRGMSWNCKSIILDECFPGYEKVITEAGPIKIGSLCEKFNANEELPLIKTFNEVSKKFEWKKIVKVWSNGLKKIVQVKMGRGFVHCTGNHPFLTTKGWVKAKDLLSGDILMSENVDSFFNRKAFNDDQKQIFCGTFLGNGKIISNQLSVTHGINREQEGYCRWKAQLFNVEKFEETDDTISFQTPLFCEPDGNFKDNTNWILANLDWRGIAAWYMDDGNLNPTKDRVTLYTYPTNDGNQLEFVKKFNSLGLKCSLKEIDLKKKGKYVKMLVFDPENTKKFLQNVDPYIYKSMKHKASHSFDSVVPYRWNNKYLENNQITCLGVTSVPQQKEVFDIEVEDNHNFIVTPDGITGPIVHNCQNCTQKEIVTLMTRVGEFSKCFLLADPDQSDLTNGKSGGFERLQSLFSDEESQKNGICSFHFTEEDIKRSELVKFVVTKLKNIKQ